MRSTVFSHCTFPVLCARRQKRPLLHRVLSEAPEYFEDYVEYKTQETALPKGHAEEGTSEQKYVSAHTQPAPDRQTRLYETMRRVREGRMAVVECWITQIYHLHIRGKRFVCARCAARERKSEAGRCLGLQ